MKKRKAVTRELTTRYRGETKKQKGEISIDGDTEGKLLKVSASTIDRLLREQKKEI